MSITKKDIEHVAHLARLALSDEEKEKYTRELAQILDYVGQLQGVETKDVDVNLAEVKPLNQTREDESKASAVQEEILSQAPKRRDRFFQVKAVLEE